jgi:uncharacterized protein (TIGR01777 family)
VGSALVGQLRKDGYEVATLGRSANSDLNWDSNWRDSLNGTAGVINLAGSTIAVPWTSENRKQILESRVETTRQIADAISACSVPPAAWINASAVGFYGNREEETITEPSPSGSGFLAEVCVAWEAPLWTVDNGVTRTCAMRLGSVLAKGGGALPPLVALAKSFVGGSHGSGNQYLPCVAIQDVVKAFQFGLEIKISGPINVVTQTPIRNADFMATLRRLLGRPFAPPAPAWALRLAARAGAPPAELLLDGAKVLPTVLMQSGFGFTYPTPETAILANL